MTRPWTSVVKSLRRAASAGLSSSSSCASSAWSSIARAAATSVEHSASTNFVFWKFDSGVPNEVRSCAYSEARRIAASAVPTALTAIVSRSCARLADRYWKALPTSPRTFASVTVTSVKCSSTVSWLLMPILWRVAPTSKPAASDGTTKIVRPPRRSAGSNAEVRATTSTRSAFAPPEMKVLDPLSVHVPSSFRCARVVMPVRSDPVPGSVIAIAVMRVPFAIPGSQRCFWSSVAYDRMYGVTTSWWTRSVPRLVAARAVSSVRIALYLKVSVCPPPPYSSGICRPMRPSSPIRANTDRSMRPASSYCWKDGASSRST